MNSRLMPHNSGESDLIWLFLALETSTREMYVLTVLSREMPVAWVLQGVHFSNQLVNYYFTLRQYDGNQLH